MPLVDSFLEGLAARPLMADLALDCRSLVERYRDHEQVLARGFRRRYLTAPVTWHEGVRVGGNQTRFSRVRAGSRSSPRTLFLCARKGFWSSCGGSMVADPTFLAFLAYVAQHTNDDARPYIRLQVIGRHTSTVACGKLTLDPRDRDRDSIARKLRWSTSTKKAIILRLSNVYWTCSADLHNLFTSFPTRCQAYRTISLLSRRMR